MLIIPQCRFCNADKATCPIKQGLKAKLQQAGIKVRLKHKCEEWRTHMKYKEGDTVEFGFMRFVDYDGDGGHWERCDETVQGVISERTKKRPIYIITIDQAAMDVINKASEQYAKSVVADTMYVEDQWGGCLKNNGYYLAPVRERFIKGIVSNNPHPNNL